LFFWALGISLIEAGFARAPNPFALGAMAQPEAKARGA
jgi:hypothetical protein